MRILLIDHQATQYRTFNEGLERNGFSVDTVNSENAVTSSAIAEDYALILLNSVRPGVDGLHALRVIRHKTNTPLLVLTERDSVAARMAGLELGVNDYLVKPFPFSELLARVRTLARRTSRCHREVLRLADLELDERSAKCSRDGVELELTGTEFALLLVMLRNQGKVLSRPLLAKLVWDLDFDSKNKNNAVDVAIFRLRSKLDAPFEVMLLHTVRGEGYVLEERPGSLLRK
ncbi:two-component system, OmpR family, copper resistance phosphate regulon response regulator CusR [Variovorax sp. YR266]|uniref:winged helix-turn-helix domain-containing protein n=1 Tax=Variovorax sp. YR266 TaxID=1884386 RepID=UPI0008985A1F|nr:winged helix-turn-helix domain-containing protein [Variovorax sp. YR266]SDY33804.1 two-component system, OmpR family, copper resistance phosphate regulon response regulator CusR [Variovorax sp. YR266]